MSLLKKLFGRSGESEKSSPEWKPRFVERAPRVRLLALHRVHFEPKRPAFATRVGIANISTSGVGFLKESISPWPATQERLEGTLFLDEVSFPIELRVVRQNSNTVGASFLNSTEALRLALQRFFEIEMRALAMTEVHPRFIKNPPEGQARWFVGENNAEIHLVTSGQEILHYTLSFFGNHVEGARGKATRMGTVTGMDERSGPHAYKASALVEWETKPNSGMVKAAQRFVANCPGLEPQLVAQLQQSIETLLGR